MGTILYENEAMLVPELEKPVHVARIAESMDGYHRFDILGQRTFQLIRGDIEGPGIRVDEYRFDALGKAERAEGPTRIGGERDLPAFQSELAEEVLEGRPPVVEGEDIGTREQRSHLFEEGILGIVTLRAGLHR
jgi:hypothetical protein